MSGLKIISHLSIVCARGVCKVLCSFVLKSTNPNKNLFFPNNLIMNEWLLLWTNLFWGDEAALRGVIERHLLLGIHHLWAGWVDIVGSHRLWATICLYPWGTGRHYWWVLMVEMKVEKIKEDWCEYHRTRTSAAAPPADEGYMPIDFTITNILSEDLKILNSIW